MNAALRCLLEVVEAYDIRLEVIHVRRKANQASDALSNLDIPKFLERARGEGILTGREVCGVERLPGGHSSFERHLRDL